MANLDDAIKSRLGARSWVVRASRRLDTLCTVPTPDIIEIVDAVEDFDKRLGSLENFQAKVELAIEVDKLEEDIQKAADFIEQARVPRIKASKIISSAKNSSEKNNGTSVSGQARLPKLELPSFGGDPTRWLEFWDQFKAVVDSNDTLPDVTKFSYLRSLLKGEAKIAVQGLTLTDKHYAIACSLLEKRYGRPERIIFSHISELLNITVPKQTTVSSLWHLQDQLQTHIRSLEALGVKGSQYGVILTPLILSRLPPSIRLEWAREGENRESDLAWLLNFLQKEIERRERSQTFSGSEAASVSASEKRAPRMSTVAALPAASPSSSRCYLCNKNHTTSRCWELSRVSLSERKERLRKASVCFRCLEKDHRFSNCVAKCSKCKGGHHNILCGKPGGGPQVNQSRSVKPAVNNHSSYGPAPGTTPGSGPSEPVSGVACASVPVSNPKSRCVLLQTARVKVHGVMGTADALILFDTGSHRSYVSAAFVNKIKPDWVGTESISYAAFGSDTSTQGKQCDQFQLKLQTSKGAKESLFVTEVPVICAPVYRPHIPQQVLSSFGELDFADHFEGEEVRVDILVGLDAYWRFITPAQVKSSHGLVAQETMFGWILSGCLTGSQMSMDKVSHQLLCLNDISEHVIRRFWDIESIGIIDQDISSTSNAVLDEFNNTVQFKDGRYEVALPWKATGTGENKGQCLLNNFKQAKMRLKNLNRKLERDESLKMRYNEVLREMEQSGITVEVPSEDMVSGHPTFYMPHRPVINESRLTTKVRPVFDASARGYNGVSLNDCLVTGPCLLPNLVEMLIRFRRWNVALTSDITKAFLQVRVRPEDQDVHRFLWQDGSEVRVMKFVRVPFGNKSSPFLLNATIKHHLSKFAPTNTVQELSDNLYVDDWLSGADDDVQACDMMIEATQVMSKASMNLSKWGSNSEKVADLLQRDFQDKHIASESVKVLGVKWMATHDCFMFDGVVVPDGLCVTKRVVLSFIARLFDPLGFLTPFIVLAKALFQELWKQGLDWDDQISENDCLCFTRWVKGLDKLRGWKIPRRYARPPKIPWSELEVELHAFGDASESAYGACVYLRVLIGDNSWLSSLVLSKARVAPLKKITLPRLELLGAVLCARLLVFVRQALKLPVSVQYQCWTDSTVVLQWIKSDAHKWKTFVSNRVAEIQSLTSPSQWRNCPGKDNPADLVTRGIYAEDLVASDVWLKGPRFLDSNIAVSEMFECSDQLDFVGVAEEIASSAPALNVIDKLWQPWLDVERWSDLCKAIRVVAWITRFCFNARHSLPERHSGDLTFDELSIAKKQLFISAQHQSFSNELRLLQKDRPVTKGSPIAKLSPFIGKDGLMRIEGRLHFSQLSEEEKHPIILPKSHLSLLLVRYHHILMKHAGVPMLIASLRDHFWIIGVRQLAKKVKRECLACQRQDAAAGSEKMAPLPRLRVTQAPPFNVTGIDHAGPLYCSDSAGMKFYVLLFTCAVIRAVHLELVRSLTCDETLLALRRFAARRGFPSVIYSDNAKGFVAAQGELLKKFGTSTPDWKFIAPRAPWWGGWWERLVRSVKSALRKSVGSKRLSVSELETTLCEVEACINSRPLTFVGDELDASTPLTPSHFLTGNSTLFPPSMCVDIPRVGRQHLIDRKKARDDILERFWSVWVSEYLRNLPPSKGKKVSKSQLKEGSVVLVRNVGCARLQWPMGIVQKVFPGRDGLVRSVEVKTPKGVLVRPIQLVHDLEISDCICDTHCPTGDIPQLTPDNRRAHDLVDLQGTAETEGPSDTTATDPAKVGSSSVTMADHHRVSRYGRIIKPVKKLNL